MSTDSQVTPVQTVGPYFTLGLLHGDDNVLVKDDTPGDRITLEGKVFDGQGKPIFNVMLEIWQADAQGHYNHPDDAGTAKPGFIGFGRARTDEDGHYSFTTIKPGRVSDEDGTLAAPHIVMLVHASGVDHPLMTRVYFPGEDGNDEDAVFQRVPELRRPTLVAGGQDGAYRFDVVLRGRADELVLESKVDSTGTAEASGDDLEETVFLEFH